MFHLLLKKMFVFGTTFKLLGAETRVIEIRASIKKLALGKDSLTANVIGMLEM
jgi:hypothetical protein